MSPVVFWQDSEFLAMNFQFAPLYRLGLGYQFKGTSILACSTSPHFTDEGKLINPITPDMAFSVVSVVS